MFTLQRRGELRAPNGDPELQRALDKHVPYEYIIGWLREREGRQGVANRVLVIQSGTASGKSITIPSEIYGALVRGRYVSGGGIICTQPRVITAIANVHQIVAIPKYGATLHIGDTIGWSTRFSKLRPRRISLLSATLGILAVQLQIYTDAEIMSLYRYILIDEAHERSLEADITFAALKGFLHRNAHLPGCPFIVLMSATIDAPKFARYFLDIAPARDVSAVLENIIICNPAQSFAREWRWPREPSRNIVETIKRIVFDVMDSAPAPRETWMPGASPSDAIIGEQTERDDILVFLPGQYEIINTRTTLVSENNRRVGQGKTCAQIVILTRETFGGDNLEVRQLTLPLRELPPGTAKVCPRPERRVILATNIAETGITFNTLRYVIDSGFHRGNEYNPNLRADVLISKPAPMSRITQRWGRVGRKFPGVIYPLYTEGMHAQLSEEQLPDIATASLNKIILQIVFDQQKIKHALGGASWLAPARDQKGRVTSSSARDDSRAAQDDARAAQDDARAAQDDARAAQDDARAAQARDDRRVPYFRVDDIDMPDAPQPDILLDGLNHAYALGFISRAPPVFTPDLEEFLATTERAPANRVGITRLGRVAIELITFIESIEALRMVLAGFSWGYRVADLVVIALSSFLKRAGETATGEVAAHLSLMTAPQINVSAAYGDIFPLLDSASETAEPSGAIDAMNAWHAILGDTFFDALVIGASLDVVLAREKSADMIVMFEGWCAKMGLSTDSALKFIEARDATNSALIGLGFDIYRGVSLIDLARDRRRDAAALADAILRYKRCIYDGYRLNVVRWNASEGYYRTNTGLRVLADAVESKFPRATIGASSPDLIGHAQTAVFGSFAGKLRRESLAYDIHSDQVSILDGFIGEDPYFAQ
ncbi:MAG: hypothetical protein M0R66_00310 [Candidatus Omnitrophica bacterium]|nr:hypothetical protein [Candidatus Omnitrophota bacterium]